MYAASSWQQPVIGDPLAVHDSVTVDDSPVACDIAAVCDRGSKSHQGGCSWESELKLLSESAFRRLQILQCKRRIATWQPGGITIEPPRSSGRLAGPHCT